VRWGAFGVCAVLAVFIITRHPGLRRRPLILSALVVGCLAVAWLANQLPGLPYRRAESTVAKQVVVETSGAPDAHVQSLDSASPVAKIRVQNPPQAITFVLELKKSLPELYEEQKYFLYGAGRINFDTRSQARVDAGRFEAQLVATLMARDQRGGLGDWANASMTIGNAKGHVIRSQLLRDQGPQSGPRPTNPRMDMQRGRAEGKQILLTVKYGELGFVPGQTVWVAFVDEAASGYGGGQLLPSFQLVLK
jgi:hypothetical protein